jgi:uncharacterized protein (UPF0264 family)
MAEDAGEALFELVMGRNIRGHRARNKGASEVRLLVSVASVTEAEAALQGGADIVDAKDPTRGAIAPVGRDTLAAVRRMVPPEVPLSAALGDAGSPAELEAAVELVTVPLAYVKLGLSGRPDRGQAAGLLGRARQIAAGLPGAPGLIAVAYADWSRAGTLPVEIFPELVIACGARGLLVDTAVKDGRPLFDWISVEALEALGRSLAAGGLEFAVAGSLALDQVDAARRTGASILGVRGAVCQGGRAGRLSADRVAQLVRSLSSSESISSTPTTDQRRSAASALEK